VGKPLMAAAMVHSGSIHLLQATGRCSTKVSPQGMFSNAAAGVARQANSICWWGRWETSPLKKKRCESSISFGKRPDSAMVGRSNADF